LTAVGLWSGREDINDQKLGVYTAFGTREMLTPAEATTVAFEFINGHNSRTD